MGDLTSLRQQLNALDGKGYKAYKALQGSYQFPQFELEINYVQGDPFAAPSRLRILLPQAQAEFPPDCWRSGIRAIALADFLTRQFDNKARQFPSQRGSGKSGQISISSPSQAILPRTAIRVMANTVEVRFRVGLPAFGRRIAGQQAAQILCDDLPAIVQQTLFYRHLDPQAIQQHCNTAEDADCLRQQLVDRGLVAFIADGAMLPRRSGIDDRPMPEGLAFESPPDLRVSLSCPHGGQITGMGIPQGITLIVGGGYHGKSTLLRAIEAGIYNHIPGDGREQVVTDGSAVKIRAEDGRSIAGVDISPFINHLPQGRSTPAFSTANASGSTSQAASIIEAVEAQAKVLLVDEDTSATNFMIRDRRMQALIAKDREPITPFIDKVGQLHRDLDISTVLVMGGSGDYFDAADCIIAMENYQPQEVTARAKAIAAEYKTDRDPEGGEQFGQPYSRHIQPDGIDPSRGKREVSLKVRGLNQLSLGYEDIDLSAVEQIIETDQVQAIAAAIVYAQRHWIDGQRSVPEVLFAVAADMERYGLDCLDARLQGNLAWFRPQELAAAINRLRSLVVNVKHV
ncbi:ATPase [filamentous cyanobacterium CCP5]|nr:ATPase [filamentous cyanobacterium CCP5]